MAFSSTFELRGGLRKQATSEKVRRDDCWTFCRVNKAGYSKQDFIPPVTHFAPENCNYRFTAIWYPCLSLPILQRCQSRLQFPPWWIALTSCLQSQRMCHYTTRSDGQNQKHNAVGLKIYKWGEGWGSTDPLLKTDHNSRRWMVRNLGQWWGEIHCGDVWKASLGAVLFVHMSAQLNVHHFLCFIFFPPSSRDYTEYISDIDILRNGL